MSLMLLGHDTLREQIGVFLTTAVRHKSLFSSERTVAILPAPSASWRAVSVR
jgi:hypothetical protein